MRVAIVGTGYVGLVSGAGLAAVGHQVVCVDLQPARVETIMRGEPPFYEPGLPELLARAREASNLTATTDLATAVANAELTLVAVGTPPGPTGPDLSQVERAARQIGVALKGRQDHPVVAVKSTVIPGTTEGLVARALLETAGMPVAVASNPEYLREGRAVDDFMRPDRVVIGASHARAVAVLQELYAPFDCPKVVTTPANAELTKFASNTLLATLISFANELAGICEHVPGADVQTVMEALYLDHRISPLIDGRRIKPAITTYLQAGIGFGGSCLPKDVDALRAFAHGQDVATPLLDAVGRVNLARPTQIVAWLDEALGGLADRTVTVLGLTFKPDTDDMRMSPSLALVEALVKLGARVQAHDPLVYESARALVPAGVLVTREPEEALGGAHAAVIGTAWPEYGRWDWATLAGRMARPLVLDGRRALMGVALPPWIEYRPVGRAVTPESDGRGGTP